MSCGTQRIEERGISGRFCRHDVAKGWGWAGLGEQSPPSGTPCLASLAPWAPSVGWSPQGAVGGIIL